MRQNAAHHAGKGEIGVLRGKVKPVYFCQVPRGHNERIPAESVPRLEVTFYFMLSLQE